jgi:hypothetical protein
MASNAGGFRYPVGSDTPDIPRDIKYLADDVNSYALLKTGGTATGNISVPTPTLSGHAANKAYVDAHQRPVAWKVNPANITSATYGTTNKVQAWKYDFSSPFLNSNWIIQAIWNCDLKENAIVTFNLATMAYQSSSVYRTNNRIAHPYSDYSTDIIQFGPISITAVDIMTAGTGVSVMLETSLTGTGAKSVNVENQTLNVLAWPTLQTSIGTWPTAT